MTGSLRAQASNPGQGLQGAYFANRDLGGTPALTRVDPTINFDWGYGSPGANVPNDSFSIRWTGQIQPRYAESYIFMGYRDNGFRLWIGGQLIVDLWNNEWGAYESRPITLQANRRYDIKVEYYEDYGGASVSLKWRSPSQPEEVVPALCLFPPNTPETPVSTGNKDTETEVTTSRGGGLTGAGLRGEFYDNRELRGPPKLTRVDPTINFHWGYGSPGAEVPNDSFSIRWTGQIQPRFAESYVFKGYRDNGFRLWIDGQLIVDLWNNEWGAYESRPITLQANRRYDIKIEYYEDYGGASVSLKWRSPSQPEEVVPAQCLFPAKTTTGEPEEPGGQLDRTRWFATRGSWNDHFGEGKPFDASGITVADGELTLNADQTDQVGVLYSKPIPVAPGSTVIIRRRIFVHTANREFEGALMAYGVADAGLSATKPAMDQSLFYIGYRNYDYQTDQNLFTLADGSVYPKGPGKFVGGTAPTTPPLWDQWFNEEVRYNAGTGDTVYLINGQERMRLQARRLDQPYLKLLLHPYGWYTGHYLRMRDFQVTVEPGATKPPEGNGTGLFGAYFANPDCAGSPQFTRVDWTIKFIWGNDSPGVGVPANNFSVRWTGQIQPRYSEAYVFCGYRDDGVRVWIDGRLVIDQWNPGNYTPFASAPIMLTAGQRYDIRVEYLQLQGQARFDLQWKSPSQPEETIPGACLFPVNTPDTPVSTGTRDTGTEVTTPHGGSRAGAGLRGEFYDNRELRGPPKLTRVDPTINFDWGYGSPDPQVPGDNFGIRWTGQIQPRYGESYIFTGYRDNGFRLWLDGQLIVDLWNNEWGAYESRPIALQANRRHDIKIEYYEDYGGASVSLKWRSPSQPEEVVPSQCLFPTKTTTGEQGSTGPGANTDLRTLLLNTTYTWSDNGNTLGTITFAADGVARPSWSGMPHVWRIDASGALVISGGGNTYVTRLTHVPGDGSFNGVRDRSSQVQDGTRSALRPVGNPNP